MIGTHVKGMPDKNREKSEQIISYFGHTNRVSEIPYTDIRFGTVHD